MSRYDLQISVAFRHHSVNEQQAEKMEGLRALARDFAEGIARLCPESRETSLALTKAEEALMHANSSIARHGA